MSIRMLALGAFVAGAVAWSLPGTAATPAAAPSAAISAADPLQNVEFDVFLPIRNRDQLEQLIEQQQDPASPLYHQWLTPKSFAAQFGPTAASLARVKAALEAQGFKVTAVQTRSLHVSGNVDMVQRAFATHLDRVVRSAHAPRLVAKGGLSLPAVLAAENVVIPNFSPRPNARPHAVNLGAVVPDNRRSDHGGYYYNDLKQAYDYPSYETKVNGQTLDGSGAKVAILMSNDVLDSDVQAMFDHEHFSTTTGKPDPTLAGRVYVNGGAPFDPNASFEASLDVQQVIGGAPGSAVTLVDIPDLSDANILAGYLDIVESNAYDVVNSSFGGCELFYDAAYNGGVSYYGVLDTYDTLFAQGNSQGITFVASSGDSGGLGCPDTSYFSGDPNATPKFLPGIEQPADSPHVTAVGGTNLITTTPPSPQTVPPTLTSQYVGENAFGDPEIPYDPYGLGLNVSGGYWGAGGGVSAHFKSPRYQKLVDTRSRMRTVPDIGMQVGGCPGGISVLPCGTPRSYVIIWDGGKAYGVIGTSVSSPEFVGALALDIQLTGGRLGQINTYLYRKALEQTLFGGDEAPAAFRFYHRDIDGFDGYYKLNGEKTNYSYLIGNGTPDVRRLFGLCDFWSCQAEAAGDPQTPSNP